jgi:NAD(P)-dependent dehydrogenase (short-subunit alcohol dehydrogenase family)
MLLQNRVALITGAGRGVGREIALCFAAEGAAVVVNDVGVDLGGTGADRAPADEVVDEIRAMGGRAVAVYDSVADFAAAGRITDAACDAFGRVDILVNNAGILRDRTLVRMSEEEFDTVITVHLKGTFNMARHVAPRMREQGYGRIVNMTSSSGLQGNFGQTNYSAAKGGIMGMTFTWALELGGSGITVNAFAPVAATRMSLPLYERAGVEPPDYAHPRHNGPFVAYLASEHAGHVNGQVFTRFEYGYMIYNGPEWRAAMFNDGDWTPQQVADRFDATLGRFVQPIGIRPASTWKTS